MKFKKILLLTFSLIFANNIFSAEKAEPSTIDQIERLPDNLREPAMGFYFLDGEVEITYHPTIDDHEISMSLEVDRRETVDALLGTLETGGFNYAIQPPDGGFAPQTFILTAYRSVTPTNALPIDEEPTALTPRRGPYAKCATTRTRTL